MSSPSLRTPQRLTAAEAVSRLRPGARVALSGNAATPTPLLHELMNQGERLRGSELYSVLLMGENPFPDAGSPFLRRALFMGPADRHAYGQGQVDYIPVFLKDIPELFTSGWLPLDAAIVQVSPPDRHGFVSLGTEVVGMQAAARKAPLVIALVNAQMPRMYGDCHLHLSELDVLVEDDFALPGAPAPALTPEEILIGQHIADLVQDGDTLQIGIGAIPDAALAAMHGKKDLGLHTELISTSVMHAVQAGIITGRRKTVHPGQITGTLMLGTPELYRFADRNPMIQMYPSNYTNDVNLIARNHRMTAINSAIEIDLTGQVCADSVGTRMVSGFGGQLDFVRGASASEGGRAIMAVTSTAQVGGRAVSRIVPTLQPGAGVVTTRGDVRYVVTEYGVADLYGLSLSERAQALTAIAHPDFREELRAAAEARGLRPLSVAPGQAGG
ncbi:acetyl-CoA hydrolase/transferase (plasmid) [Deinococcus proteolyticus MRP]|uniref:Acetyl-CoA hydrolase/transferase n=1 Tax=Deinococcus proteolyticus (strain ATCC 35074 / DSM 20540 / JCM 6276 / NBRC 101906 / NCIMB 13154 / VKM Ac-1939 / CCM 2703 / MRP) TaxID=693977 RepID=F0RQ27_DEIPM|nr:MULTISPECIES: acetyl-CoA hydrolase/transferase C-terminal domain-containing protein [Deinococcus]ADY27229.1 acetyl-CoA hydrolase/transferase [Deinococcus proteolyticus MRP]MCY1704099.1 acetyl-CoA hydrolase/transferase family protein [Deinococcus sp. SL84]